MSLRLSFTVVLAASTFACSDPVPPPAQAGLKLSLRNASPAIAGKSCPVTALTKTVPETDPNNLMEGPTTTSPGVRVIDGESNSKISCSVKGSGTFNVSASIAYSGVTFTILGGTVTSGGTGTASMSVYTPETFSISSPSSTPCTLDVSMGDLQAQPGSMWATFRCASLETAPGTACSADGVIVIENCTE